MQRTGILVLPVHRCQGIGGRPRQLLRRRGGSAAPGRGVPAHQQSPPALRERQHEQLRRGPGSDPGPAEFYVHVYVGACLS